MHDNNNTRSQSQEQTSGRKRQGFAALSEAERSKIASKGGQAAHEQGVAHEWDSSEAKAAGQKGGRARGENQRQNQSVADRSNEPSE